jgi:hypothetical protein
MPSYDFYLNSNSDIDDLGYMELADDAAALAFGEQVIRDSMEGDAEQYTGWTIDIAEGERTVASIPFAADACRNQTQ